MRVYYDYQIMIAQKFGGISRYIYEISSRLPALGADAEISCVHNMNYYFAEKFGLHEMTRLQQGVFHVLGKMKRGLDLIRGNYDIFHPTYYYASKPPHGKFVVTVHDMTHEIFSGKYPVNPRVISAKRRIIPQADRIIAVSENTKRDILKYFPGISPAKISVIYHGASSAPVSKSHKVMPYDYVLFVGKRSMYKNFSRFTSAMKGIMSKNWDIDVLCAGGGAFTEEEISSFGEFSGRFHQAELTDADLSQAYAGAVCFVFPSEYEGFGIPVLEAFAAECPVICAEAGSLPEVAGDSAVYFDPLDIDDMAGKILAVIEDENIREELRHSGRERLKFFDWDKAARETLECYNLALKGA